MRLLKGSRLAVLVKIVTLAITISVLGTLSLAAFAHGETAIGFFIAIAILALSVTYFSNISVPMKFFLPGMILLVAFVVVPIVYTLTMSAYKYQTGNYISKQEAITQDLSLGVEPDAAGTTFDIAIGRDSQGNLAVLASDSASSTYFLTTEKTKVSLKPTDVTLNADGVAVGTAGFTKFNNDQLSAVADQASKARFAYDSKYFLLTQGFDLGSINTQSLSYNSSTDIFKNKATGAVYKDNGRGNFVNVKDKNDILPVGWRAPIWFENFSKLFTDPLIRGPLISVFIWTVAFASITVLTQFALGLLIAWPSTRKYAAVAFIGRSLFCLTQCRAL